jgi:hypothetical protein
MVKRQEIKKRRKRENKKIKIKECDKLEGKKQNLRQHLRCSPLHAAAARIHLCNDSGTHRAVLYSWHL